MKKILFFALIIVPAFAKAQEVKEYTATNGITYHLGDTVRMGRGTGNNGAFVYIEDRGLGGLINLPGGPPGRSNGRGMPKEFANSGLIIKNIRKTQSNNLSRYVFMVSGAGPMKLSLYIDDAIAACEVTPCKTKADASSAPVASVADEIKKLKELMDSGAITKEEFEARKKKLLDQ